MSAPLVWDTQRRSRAARLERARAHSAGKLVDAAAIGAFGWPLRWAAPVLADVTAFIENAPPAR